MKSITGKVTYQQLSTGFWGIIDESGGKWRPVNMPEQLKQDGRQVTVKAIEVDDMSIFMWGKAVRIIAFST